ncbi:MAG: hypothetical protein RL377_1714 [Bacteroidota bacterium]
MISINYPEYPFKIQKEAGKDCIFDPLRKTWVVLTPEEWVRQNFIQYLIQVKQYPASLIAIEKTIQLGELKKRFDIVVYKNEAAWILIECKEANVSLTEKTLEQILQYQQVIEASYLVMTNGHTTYGAKIETGKLHYLQSLPDYIN